MTDIQCKLCSFLLEEHFGSLVQCIGTDLIKNGRRTIASIFHATGLPLIKIKEGLNILIKYGFVTYRENQGSILYNIECNKIIRILHYPRYMFYVKTHCGNESEIMFEEVLKHGYITASALIIRTHKRFEESPSVQEISIADLKNSFELLVKNQFLVRSISFESKADDTIKPNYHLPEFNLKAISNLLQKQDGDPGDNKIYWKINFDRFTQDLRDEIVILAMTQRFDKNAGELMRQLINLMFLRTASWADTSNPIPYTEIKDAMKKSNYPDLEQYLDQYLRLIEEDASQFIQRVGDSGGGQYSVNMKNAFNQLAWTTLENIVMERFGSKAARIFRLVRNKNCVELEQIQQLAMIPAKEAKLLTYTLSQEDYIQVQETKKSGVSTGPTKTFFLFYIDLDQVVRMQIEHCYHALYNIIRRRDYESMSNKRMIDKQLRVQILSTNMKEHGATEQQLADIAEMMTPSEKEQLEKVQNAIRKLSATELQIDETLFLLTMYLRYH